MAALIKICGITNVEDLELVLSLGVEMVGINLVPSSKRFVPPEIARRLVQAVRGRSETVAVVADLSPSEIDEVRHATQVDALQHHGSEPPESLARLPQSDFKAVRVGQLADVLEARRYPGPRLLLDAKSSHGLGGTGERFDWSWVGSLVQERKVLLAGGLNERNVAEAIALVRPWAVDVASGVEASTPAAVTGGQPGPRKDPAKLSEFVRRARDLAV